MGGMHQDTTPFEVESTADRESKASLGASRDGARLEKPLTPLELTSVC
jgi:hypothetical protein